MTVRDFTADELQVEILRGGKPPTGSEIPLECKRGHGDERIGPEIAIRLETPGRLGDAGDNPAFAAGAAAPGV